MSNRWVFLTAFLTATFLVAGAFALPPYFYFELVKSSIFIAIAVLVFEDENPVAQLQIESFGSLGVGVILRDPEPAPRVPGHRDGIAHVRLGGKDGGREARRKLQHRQ